MPLLSICLIAKDEAANLPRALESVRGVADEIIVVDTGSTDGTPSIAAQLGATVFHHPWRGDFAEARNVSLSEATGQWILVMDADEALEPASAARLKSVLQTTPAEGVQIIVRSFYPPGATAQYGDAPMTRLFRNRPHHRFEQPIHEQIAPAILRGGGQIAPSDLCLWHYGYSTATAQNNQSRNQRNLDLLKDALAADPDNLYLHAMFGINHSRMEHLAEAEAHLARAAVAGEARLPPEVWQEVYLALGSLAFARGQTAEAAQWAQRSLQYAGPDTLTALRLLAQASLAQAEAQLQARVQPALAHPETADLGALAAQVEQTRSGYATAQQAFEQLRQHPRLNPQRLAETDAGLNHCQQALAMLARLAATLGRMPNSV